MVDSTLIEVSLQVGSERISVQQGLEVLQVYPLL